MTKSMFRITGATAAIAIAVALSGCGGQASDSQMTAASLPQLPATLPLAAGPATPWPTAPAAAALPGARPLRTVRVADPGDYYGYADAAYDYQDALGDAPPDYYFDYGGTDPWAWEGYDQSVVFVEPIDGGYRSYYYRPGADVPYFVRDPDYGYGYDNGNLAVVYDDFGGVVPYADYGPRVDYASRYFARGRDLYAASRERQRRAVAAVDWAARSSAIAASRSRWTALRERQPQWRDYHAKAAAREATYWREEDVRRQADTRRFAEWRSQDFRTPPPPRAIPVAWTKARWAGDQNRFLPARAERARPAAQPPRREPPQGAVGNARADQRGRDNAPAMVPARPNPGRAVARGQRGSPATGPMRVIREPQAGPAKARIERPRDARGNGRNRAVQPPQTKAQPAQVSRQPAQGNPGNAARVQPKRQPRAARPQPRPQLQAARAQPRPQPQAQPRVNRGQGNGGGRAARTPQPPRALRVEAPRAPRMEAPRAQPRPQAAAPQPARNGGGGGKGNRGGGNGGGGDKKHGHG
ncbi:hypothetical protein [Sphingomonas sp.]|jgi:hypothetical protein|uniref:hypothetical protein n=1 Tax=Sphingomonas sp. TaxID=28214 RepID=UPI002E324AC5|nr:hypothetical protein [Sphingomonas sp.]HEX4692988.1 hypothetical protein [Sphingomonas sp.]